MLDSSFPLPQTWIEESSQARLADAAEEAFGRRPWQDRDWPGNIHRGISPMEKRNYHDSHPVPDYGESAPRHVLSYEQPLVGRDDVEVLQITATTMTPAAARAYLTALWADPSLPFVTAHTHPSVRLNGAVGYFTVGGPALAVPLHHPTEPPKIKPRARGRGNYAALPEPVDRTSLTPLPVEVSNPEGLEDADFAWAARHHQSLSQNQILTGTLRLRDIEPLEYSTNGRVPEGGETLQVKLMGPSGVLGYFEDTAAAHAALGDAVASRQYRNREYLDDFAGIDHFADDYTIVPCLMKDGRETTGTLTTRLTAARATVYAEVTTVTPSKKLPVTGWMMSWHTADWHRNNTWVERNKETAGPPLRLRDRWR